MNRSEGITGTAHVRQHVRAVRIGLVVFDVLSESNSQRLQFIDRESVVASDSTVLRTVSLACRARRPTRNCASSTCLRRGLSLCDALGRTEPESLAAEKGGVEVAHADASSLALIRCFEMGGELVALGTANSPTSPRYLPAHNAARIGRIVRGLRIR